MVSSKTITVDDPELGMFAGTAAAREIEKLRGDSDRWHKLADQHLAQAMENGAEANRLRGEFKNFHRLLCDRFGSAHDEIDWERDQLSLIEWIVNRGAHEIERLRRDLFSAETREKLIREERDELQKRNTPEKDALRPSPYRTALMRAMLEQIRRGPPFEMENGEVASWTAALASKALEAEERLRPAEADKDDYLRVMFGRLIDAADRLAHGMGMPQETWIQFIDECRMTNAGAAVETAPSLAQQGRAAFDEYAATITERSFMGAREAAFMRGFLAGSRACSPVEAPEKPAVHAAFERGCHVLMEMMKAYERRVRTDCRTPEDLAKRPWECAEYVAAANYLRAVWRPEEKSEPSPRPCKYCGEERTPHGTFHRGGCEGLQDVKVSRLRLDYLIENGRCPNPSCDLPAGHDGDHARLPVETSRVTADEFHVLRILGNDQISAARARELIDVIRKGEKPELPPFNGAMEELIVKHMVDRFLGWRLPENFSPDAGISFKPTFNDHMPFGPQKYNPVGTNLFAADQAEAMVRYMIEGMPPENGTALSKGDER